VERITGHYRVLVVASHRQGRAPNQRFRFEQYIDYLKSEGILCELSYLIEPNDDAFLYSKGNFWSKFMFIRRSRKKRKKDLKRLKEFDVVLIVREALMTGSTFFERAVKASNIPMIFDFDDSIWLMNVSKANRYFSFMKNPSKTKDLISMSNLVFAGNQYLADYALKYNHNILIVPTTIDTSEYTPIKRPQNSKVVIGWSGSITTIQHFEFAIPFLRRIKDMFGSKVEFRVIGDANFQNDELGIQGMAWNKDTELEDLCSFDVGIMPLPDDEWAKGKCGLKGLQYMALGIPTIMSPVGVNTEIISHGKNGFLVSSTENWIECLSLLINDVDLRNQIGMKGRLTVIQHYSVEANRNLYKKAIIDLIKSHERNEY
jgi:glycosyltransferase involved in cell wall biosynthesis